ncbi:unnamed protein product [Lymnaea stagnalis]|uniref:Uncharacterized protein n=1 Tax=Lymnaea stagnalis TaxID=6523 RepID=A0AAV2HTU9_LYMST
MLAEERRLKNQMKVEINRLELDLQEKTTLADKFANEKFQRLELETQVTCLRDVEERFKTISKDLEKEQSEKRALEVLADELKRKIAAMVSQEALQAVKEECNKERQLHAQMEKRVKDLEHSLKDTEISRDSANELLENERQLSLSLEKTVKELQAVTVQQTSAEELTRLKDELNKERAALKDLEESEADVQLLCVELEKQRTLNEQLVRKVEELESADKESSSSTMKAALDELDRERKARAKDDAKILDMEQLLDDQRIDNDAMEQKIIALEQRVVALEDELFATQDELQALQDDHDKVVKELEVSRAEVMSLDTVDGNQKLAGGVTPEFSRDKHLENSPSISTAKLNEAYNDLNTVKTKLFHTQEEYESAKIELESSRQDLSLLKQSLDMSNKHLEKSENELRALRKELAETQGSLEFTQNQLKNKQSKLESLARDRDQLQSELDAISDAQQENLSAVPFFEKERQEHLDKIATLEKLTRQLELDNREMARKLTDAMNKCEILEGQLDREKFRSSDKHLQSRRYTEQLEQDLDAANSQIRQLREELQQHQTKVFKAESDTLGLSAKFESTIARLEQDNKDLQQRHRHDLDVANRRLETACSEARELRIQNRGLEEEVTQLRADVSRLKSTNEQLESHLQAEQKQRQELENRNSVIDSELTKTWSQVRSLMEKNAHLEAASRSYEQDINTQRNNIQKIEHSIGQKEATYEASTKAIVARAENAERKTRELQRELEEVTQKMLHIEGQLTHAEKGKVHMEDAKDRLVATRNQLEGEKLQRTLLDQTVADLKHEVAILKQREAKVHSENKELQHTIIELESRLNHLREFPQKDVDSAVSESGQRSLMDQIARLQREVKDLQHELYNVSERRDVDMKRYEERKLRTKSKLIKAREFYTNERTKYMEQMKGMDDDLRLTHATLSKELEWREKMDASYKEVIRDKRELITQLSELEESLRDTKRGLSISQGRVEYLEEENARLLDLVETLTQEKYNLDRLLKEKTLALSQADFPNGTSRENNQNTGWDMYDRLDQTVPIEPPANFRESETDDDMDDSQTKRFRRGSENDSGNITFVPRGKGKFPVYSQINEFKFSQGEFYDDGDEFEA